MLDQNFTARELVSLQRFPLQIPRKNRSEPMLQSFFALSFPSIKRSTLLAGVLTCCAPSLSFHAPQSALGTTVQEAGAVGENDERTREKGAGDSEGVADTASVFRQENLMAWCIVPFDGKKRGPVERAEMLDELKLKMFAYDYRAEHVPTFEQEIEETKKRGIEISAWWFPMTLNEEAKATLALFAKAQIAPQLWVMGGGDPAMNPEQEKAFIASEVARLRPIADAAKEVGCKVALYNHGAWFGQPENLVRLVQAIDRENVGIVYNLHHAHDQLHRIPQVLNILKPHLLVLNVNGMQTDGENKGQKILVIGQGDRDVEVFQAILDSGYRGPIGILNHTDEDAYSRLKANLDGLRELTKQLK